MSTQFDFISLVYFGVHTIPLCVVYIGKSLYEMYGTAVVVYIVKQKKFTIWYLYLRRTYQLHLNQISLEGKSKIKLNSIENLN